MKKLFSALVSAAVTTSALLSSLTAGITNTVVWASEYEPILSIDTVEAYPGETVTLSFRVTEGTPWCSLGVHIDYNDELELVKKQWSEDIIYSENVGSKIATDFIDSYGYGQGVVLAVASMSDNPDISDIYSWTFTVPDDAQEGDFYELNFVDFDTFCFTNYANDSNGEYMEEYARNNWVNGGIQVIEDEPTEPPTEPVTTAPQPEYSYIVQETNAPVEWVENVSVASVENQYYSYDDTEFNSQDILLDVTYRYYHTGGTDYIYYVWEDGTTTNEVYQIREDTTYTFDKQISLKDTNVKWEYSTPADAYDTLSTNLNEDLIASIEFTCEIPPGGHAGHYTECSYTDSVTVSISAPTITEIPTTDPPVEDTPIIIPSTLTMNVGDTNEVLVANVPDGSIVAWTSDNTSVATVSNGIVTAKNAGKATIYAVCNGTVLTCSVTVTEDQYFAGDANCSGGLEIADAIIIMAYVTDPEQFPLNAAQISNSDVYQCGDGIGINDAVSVQKYLTKLISVLPESYL